MHIGFDASRINVNQRTGTENYSYELLKALLELDQPHTYTMYSRAVLPDEFRQSARAHNLVIDAPRLWTQAGLAAQIIRHQPDVLFIPAHTLPVIHRPSLRSVVTIHDLGAEYLPQYHTFPGKLYLNRATDYAVHHATHLIAVSHFTKQDLLKRYHIPDSKITVIHEGVNLDQLQPASQDNLRQVRQKYQLNQPYILFVGTIQPRKNLVRLIQAFSLIQEKNLILVLAGKKGWLSDEIYQAPMRYGIPDKVKFLGFVDDQDRQALYTSATATILPSLFEGFGLPLLESMACDTPVIAANATSLPEVVGSAGLLVDPLNPADIAQAIGQMAGDQALRQAFQQQGQTQVQKFRWQTAAQKTLAVLEKVGQHD